MALGVYISVPFCRAKCSYCNFASDVFAPALQPEYATLLIREIELTAARPLPDGSTAAAAPVDSVYWGGGTPTLLPPAAILAIMGALRANFSLLPDAEHTMEAAPGTLAPEALAAMAAAGVNRVSLGVQSMVEAEARAVGRRHDAATVAADMHHLRRAGITNISLDFIAGLPFQTAASWQVSLDRALALAPSHLSVYMLEADDDSRLGREILAAGSRYHAGHVPDEDAIADAYEFACDYLPAQGFAQYEISNFARAGDESRHNMRYWRRRPYLGFGLDAHSLAGDWRFANPDDMQAYLTPLRSSQLPRLAGARLTALQQREEFLFLGLRCNAGIALAEWQQVSAGQPAWRSQIEAIWNDLATQGLLHRTLDRIGLTARGRLLSNRVFAAFLGGEDDPFESACG